MSSVASQFCKDIFFCVVVHFNVREIRKHHKKAGNSPIILCLLKNAEERVGDFIAYHQRLGFKSFVFMDQGSSDNTITRLLNHDDRVAVYACELSFRFWNMKMRNYMVRRFATRNWALVLDIDEFFDYPSSDHLSLSHFIEYLDDNKFNSVTTQMLDLVPQSIQRTQSRFIPRDKCPYYDLQGIRKFDLSRTLFVRLNSIASNPKILAHFGGIRGSLFGLTEICLTKHALIKQNILPLRHELGHWSTNSKIADLSCVLYHYQMLSNYFEKVEDAVNTKQYYKGSSEYRSIGMVLADKTEISTNTESTLKLKGIDSLIGNEFIVVPRHFQTFVKSLQVKQADHP